MSLPPDRAHVSTEHRHVRGSLDTLSTDAFLEALLEDQASGIEAVRRVKDAITVFVDQLTGRVKGGGRLIYLGAGTSGRLGVLDASECPPTFNAAPGQIVGIIAGGDEALRRSSEAKEDDPAGAHDALHELAIASNDTVLGIAAGATTPWVLGGVEEAGRLGAMTGLLTCAPLPPSIQVDHHILLDTGAELLTGSTRLKAGTATKIALNAITTSLFLRLGKVYENLMVDLRATNAKLHDRCLRILCELCPELDRSSADLALQDADGDLKVAILMVTMRIGSSQAQEIIHGAGGNLRYAMNKQHH